MPGEKDLPKDVFNLPVEDVNVLPFPAEKSIQELALGLKPTVLRSQNFPRRSEQGPQKKLPVVLEQQVQDSALFHRVFANLFFLTLCVMFREPGPLSLRCRSCLVTNWQDYLLYFRDDPRQRSVLQVLPILLTQLIYRSMLDFFQLGPLGFIDAAQSVLRRIGTIVHFELTGFSPQATTITRSREQVFVQDLVKHPYADVTMGAALLMEADTTELKFGSTDSRPPDGSVLSDLLQMRAREKEKGYSGILDPDKKEEAMNRDKTRVDYLVDDLGQSLSHVVAVEKAVAGSYMMYSQQRKANREQRAKESEKPSAADLMSGGGGAGAGGSKDRAGAGGTPGSSTGFKKAGSPTKGGGSALSKLKRAGSTQMQRNITVKMFNAQLDKQKYDKAVRTCIFRQTTLPGRYSRQENAQFNTSWLSPMVSHTALEHATSTENPIDFSARSIVGKTTTDAFHLRFKVASRFLSASPSVYAKDEDDDDLPGAAPGGGASPARSPLHSARTEKSEARTAFSDFFRKKEKKDLIPGGRRQQAPKTAVTIEPPSGVSRNTANERLRVGRERAKLTSWAHYIRTFDTSTGAKKLGSDQEQLFREEKQYVNDMNKLTRKVQKWMEYHA
mmetsp:Transcript_28459/g.72211  ORF Transcript_28459/g.72211 Transcript_28459/m.72211 type:complete len:614 (+) Transcript_28459:1149-2990(+)